MGKTYPKWWVVGGFGQACIPKSELRIYTKNCLQKINNMKLGNNGITKGYRGENGNRVDVTVSQLK
jgi:hypothetical protein